MAGDVRSLCRLEAIQKNQQIYKYNLDTNVLPVRPILEYYQKPEPEGPSRV